MDSGNQIALATFDKYSFCFISRFIKFIFKDFSGFY